MFWFSFKITKTSTSHQLRSLDDKTRYPFHTGTSLLKLLLLVNKELNKSLQRHHIENAITLRSSTLLNRGCVCINIFNINLSYFVQLGFIINLSLDFETFILNSQNLSEKINLPKFKSDYIYSG